MAGSTRSADRKPPSRKFLKAQHQTETAKIDLKAAQRELAATEKEFDEASIKDAGGAVIADASDDIRVFRSGDFPPSDAYAARLMLVHDRGK